MSDSTPALVGIEKCGCVTYANCSKSGPTKKEKTELYEDYIETGGQLVKTTVGEAKAMPDFLPGACPHEPKGWVPRGR